MTPAELSESYLAGAACLRAAVAGMTPEQLVARPVPGAWTTLEVVAHVADFEPIMADRIKRAASHDNPTLPGVDENRLAAHLFYHDRDLEEELAVVDAIRASAARTIRRLPADTLNRVGTHTEAGVLTVERLILRATHHITHHLKFIREKREALGLRG